MMLLSCCVYVAEVRAVTRSFQSLLYILHGSEQPAHLPAARRRQA